MAAQTINAILNQNIGISNLKVLDSNGVACQGLSYALSFVSGDPTGLTLNITGGVPQQIKCVKAGTYQVQLTSTNSGGAISTDAAGDTAESDTIVVSEPAPATQTWTYS